MKKVEKYMDCDEMIRVIRNLSKSQGMYGRLLEQMLIRKTIQGEQFTSEINQMLQRNKIVDAVDFVMFFES